MTSKGEKSIFYHDKEQKNVLQDEKYKEKSEELKDWACGTNVFFSFFFWGEPFPLSFF
jgi:hypothetical protein